MPAARPSPRCIALPPEWLRGRDVDVSDAGRFFHDVWSRLRFDPLPPSDIEVVRLLPILPGLGQGSGLGRYGRSAKVPRRRRSCRQEREYKDWEHPRQDCRRCGVLQVLLVDPAVMERFLTRAARSAMWSCAPMLLIISAICLLCPQSCSCSVRDVGINLI